MDCMIEVGAGIIGAILGAIAGAIATHLLSRNKNADDSNRYALKYFGARKNIDSAIPLEKRVKVGLGIREIRVLNYAGTTIVDPDHIGYSNFPVKNELSTALFNVIKEDNVTFTIILTNPLSDAAGEAIRNGKVINSNRAYDNSNRNKIFYDACNALKKAISPNGTLYSAYQNGKIKCRLTDVSLPYALFQVIYNDPSKNHFKVDLYSPNIADEGERRTFYIYQCTNKEDYEFFDRNLNFVSTGSTDFMKADFTDDTSKET